jgi:predicted aconitase
MYEVTIGTYEDTVVVGYATTEDAAYALLGRHIVARTPASAPTVRELSADDADRLRALYAPLFATHDVV